MPGWGRHINETLAEGLGAESLARSPLFAQRDGLARLLDRFRARLARVDRHDLAAGLLFATLVVLVACTFRDYAISNDEEVQQRYGELILGYYASGFAVVLSAAGFACVGCASAGLFAY